MEGNIESFAGFASKAWEFLAAAEAVGGVPFLDVEFSNFSNGLRVLARLDEDAAPVATVLGAMRAIAELSGVDLEEGGPFQSIVFPSGHGRSASVEFDLQDGVRLKIRAIVDAEQYAVAVAETLLVEVAA